MQAHTSSGSPLGSGAASAPNSHKRTLVTLRAQLTTRACPSLAAVPYWGRAWSVARRRALPPAGDGARRGHRWRPPQQTLRAGPPCSTSPPGASPTCIGTRSPCARKCGAQRRTAPPTGCCSLHPLSPPARTGPATALRLPVSRAPVWRASFPAAPATAPRGRCTASGRVCVAGTCAQRCSSCLRGPGASARSAIGCTHLTRCADLLCRHATDVSLTFPFVSAV